MTRDKRRFYTHTRLFIFIGCLLLILVSSSIFLSLHTSPASKSSSQSTQAASNRHNTHIATETPTSTPSNTATLEGPTPTPTPLFTDNFNNTTQKWYVSNTGDGYIRSLTEKGLTLIDTNHSPLIESLPTSPKFDDFILTTTLTLKQGDKNDSVGVYLRGDSNLDHDYRVDIFGNNTYAISKEFLDTNNKLQTAYLIAPSHTSQLKSVGTSNTLTIIMKSATLILLINNKLVNVIIDEDYTHGQIALFVANGLTSSGATAIFSSIEINTAPDQFPAITTCAIMPVGTSETTPTPCTTTCTTTPISTNGTTPTPCT